MSINAEAADKVLYSCNAGLQIEWRARNRLENDPAKSFTRQLFYESLADMN